MRLQAMNTLAIGCVLACACWSAPPPVATPPATPAALKPFPTVPMAGPFASLGEYCTSLRMRHEPGLEIRCDADAFRGAPELANQPPFDEVRLFTVQALDFHCELGFRVGGQWWVLSDAMRCASPRAKSDLVSKDLDVEVVDGALVVGVTYEQSNEGYASPGPWEQLTFQIVRLCGLGAGAPSCTAEIVTRGRREVHRGDAPPKVTSFEVSIERRAGTIELVGNTSDYEHYLAKPVAAGTYRLIF